MEFASRGALRAEGSRATPLSRATRRRAAVWTCRARRLARAGRTARAARASPRAPAPCVPVVRRVRTDRAQPLRRWAERSTGASRCRPGATRPAPMTVASVESTAATATPRAPSRPIRAPADAPRRASIRTAPSTRGRSSLRWRSAESSRAAVAALAELLPGIDRHFDAHARTQRAILRERIEMNAHRDALHDLREVPGRVLRRQ